MGPRAGIILANRAYLDHDQAPRGTATPAPAQGGLLAAVRPVIAPWDGEKGTLWMGAGRGSHDRDWADAGGFEVIDTPRGPLRHRRLFFDEATWQGHYAAVANCFFWPLLHLVRDPLPLLTTYYPAPETPTSGQWDAYRRVNEAFARAVMEEGGARERTAPNCWVHDYQLALVPRLLREMGYGGAIGFFLHTPFPLVAAAAAFLDERATGYLRQFCEGLQGANVAGFQSQADLERFSFAAGSLEAARPAGSETRLVALPVGIDADELIAVAKEAAPTPAAVAIGNGLPLVAGLERADFTKGIPERLDAVARALDAGSRFNYVGIASPTRVGVRSYEPLSEALDSAAGRAAAAGERAGVSVVQLRESLPWPEVVALQRDANVVFTSSLADGMNLVPLQAAAAQSLRPPDERAVIIAGRDAGVARAFAGFEREGLVAVDPLDAEAMERVLIEAVGGRPGRVSDRFIAEVRRRDAQSWATDFLTELEGARC
ncbi:MAG: trehalose-6-phosphate synthase [Tepidiformaceae bacterium]